PLPGMRRGRRGTGGRGMLPRGARWPRDPDRPMSERYDVVVLGGGPAGAAAATEAAALGLQTLLIDEGRAAGGQVYRPPSEALRDEPQGPGDTLRRRLAESGAECRFGRR